MQEAFPRMARELLILGHLNGLWRHQRGTRQPFAKGHRQALAKDSPKQGAEQVRHILRSDNKRIRFHEVVDGEIVVADDSVVLEMVLDGSVGMIIYDRSRNLAAASKLPVHADDDATASIRERTSSASLALLSRMASRGCDLESLEIFALGAVDATSLGSGPGGIRLRRVSLAMGFAESSDARRVEFDVGLGRIVVEQGRSLRNKRRR